MISKHFRNTSSPGLTTADPRFPGPTPSSYPSTLAPPALPLGCPIPIFTLHSAFCTLHSRLAPCAVNALRSALYGFPMIPSFHYSSISGPSALCPALQVIFFGTGSAPQPTPIPRLKLFLKSRHLDFRNVRTLRGLVSSPCVGCHSSRQRTAIRLPVPRNARGRAPKEFGCLNSFGISLPCRVSPQATRVPPACACPHADRRQRPVPKYDVPPFCFDASRFARDGNCMAGREVVL